MSEDSRKDARLEQALAEWARRLEAGVPLDRRKFLSEWSDIKDELHEVLRFEARFERACAQMGGRTSPFSLTPGTIFADYEIIREVGRGAMGIVYEARQLSLQRRVALKLLSPSLGDSDRDRKRFLTEARIVSLLQSEHVVQVYEAGEAEGLPYFSMQFIDGLSLAELLRQTSESQTHQPADPQRDLAHFQSMAELGAQAAFALAEAHENRIVHRDIKPSNLLVSQGKLWITDFGLARARDLLEAASSNRHAGTLRYMSPETLQGNAQTFDGRSDIYSLGVTLYEALTLAHPFPELPGSEPLPLGRVKPSIPPDLQTVVHKAMAQEPGDRYQTAGELADDLRRFLAGEPVRARPLSTWQQFRRWLWKRRRMVLIAGGLLALGISVGLGSGGVLLYQAYQREVNLRQQTDHSRQLAVASVRELSRMVQVHVRHEPGKAREEQRTLQNALQLLEETALEAPPEHPLHEAVAHLTLRLAEAESRIGNEIRSQQLNELGANRLREVVKVYPQSHVARLELASVLGKLGSRLDREGKLLDEKSLTEAIDHIDFLLVHDSGNPDYLSRKAMLLHGHAGRLFVLKRYPESLKTEMLALKVCEELRDKFPKGHPQSYVRLCWVQGRLADLYQAMGRYAEAEQAIKENVANDQRLARDYPNQMSIRDTTIGARLGYATFLFGRNRNKEALVELSATISELTRAVERHPDIWYFRAVLLRAWYLSGIAEFAQGKDAQARQALTRILSILKEGGETPEPERWWFWLLQTPFPKLLDLKELLQKIEKSSSLGESERRILRSLHALRAGNLQASLEHLKDPATVGEPRLAAAAYTRAILHLRKGEIGEGKKWFTRAETLYKAERDPELGDRMIRLETLRQLKRD